MSPSDRWIVYQITGRKPQRAPRRQPRRGPARSWKYRAWIRTLPSAVSGQLGCEAAHTGSDGGTSQKASDFSCIPLSPEEHLEYHRIGRAEFERVNRIDCKALVRRLNHDWFAYSGQVK